MSFIDGSSENINIDDFINKALNEKKVTSSNSVKTSKENQEMNKKIRQVEQDIKEMQPYNILLDFEGKKIVLVPIDRETANKSIKKTDKIAFSYMRGEEEEFILPEKYINLNEGETFEIQNDAGQVIRTIDRDRVKIIALSDEQYARFRTAVGKALDTIKETNKMKEAAKGRVDLRGRVTSETKGKGSQTRLELFKRDTQRSGLLYAILKEQKRDEDRFRQEKAKEKDKESIERHEQWRDKDRQLFEDKKERVKRIQKREDLGVPPDDSRRKKGVPERSNNRRDLS